MKICKIDSNDISVVAQGAIDKSCTKKVLFSIRKNLPSSEIILSTWKGQDLNGLDYDVLVENEDPGAELLFHNSSQRYNLNRQIVSTKNGIKKVTKPYLLKTRTDIFLTNTNFIKYFDMFDKRCECLKILKKRVISCQYYSRLPEVLPFHPGDWVFFGLKEDVENIFDIPIAKEPETSQWFYNQRLLPEHTDGRLYNHFRFRYCPEQYIWSQFLKKNGTNFEFKHMWDITSENIYLTNISFANNLVIISDNEYGIRFAKYEISKQNDIFDFKSWQNLYNILF